MGHVPGTGTAGGGRKQGLCDTNRKGLIPCKATCLAQHSCSVHVKDRNGDVKMSPTQGTDEQEYSGEDDCLAHDRPGFDPQQK